MKYSYHIMPDGNITAVCDQNPACIKPPRQDLNMPVSCLELQRLNLPGANITLILRVVNK